MSAYGLSTVNWALFLAAASDVRAQERYFDSGGMRIRYTDNGHGVPVLLIHGVTLGIEQNWQRPGVIAELAKEYRVLAIDCRGHGKSDKPPDPRAYGTAMVVE